MSKSEYKYVIVVVVVPDPELCITHAITHINVKPAGKEARVILSSSI